MKSKFILLSITLITNYLHSMSHYSGLIDIILNHPDTPEIDHEIKLFKYTINTPVSDFDYPLGFAAYEHKEHAVASLLKHGALVNISTNYYRHQTALHRACYNTNLKDEEKTARIINILLKHGANINARDEAGMTPLHLSTCVITSMKASEIILAYGADINIENYYGDRPIDELDKQIRLQKNYKKKPDYRNVAMFDWLTAVYEWNGKSQLRQIWITGAILTARQIHTPQSQPATPTVINTCTAIIPYTKPKTCCNPKCTLM